MAQPMENIIIYGGGGHGKAVIDLLRVLDRYNIVGILDDELMTGADILGIPILGGNDALNQVYEDGTHFAINAVGGIGNIDSRINVFKKLKSAGFICPAVIHPTAFVEVSATLAAGVQIFPHAYVGSAVSVGYGAIINTGAIISHDCTLGDYSILSPGATLAGGSAIGEATLIGMRSTVNVNVEVGAHVTVGNGATVKNTIPDNTKVWAGTIWPPRV